MAMGNQPEIRPGKWSILLPLILAAGVYLLTTTNRGVTDYDEGYYSQPPIRMAEHGDWVTPYANRIRFLEKPPLLYWVTAASFRVFGVNEFALRLPTAFAVIALVWIVMLTARLAAGTLSIWAAGLSAAFSAGVYLFTRETLHDVWLVLFLALAMYAFFKWYLDPRHALGPALLFYAAMAGAVMCKSLIGIAFCAGIAVVFFLFSREMPGWRTLHLVPGSLLFLALTVPWHLLAAAQNEGFLEFFFVGEQFLRFFGKREPPVLWSVPLLTFWVLVPVWFFPWTAFLPAAYCAGRSSGDKKIRALAALALAWAAVVLGFFSVSDRLEHYAFAALPAFSLLAAVAFSRDGKNKAILWAYRLLAALGVLAIICCVVAGMRLASGNGFPFGAAGPADRLAETDFSIMADMPPEMLSNLLAPAAVTAVVLAAGFLSALWFEGRRRRAYALIIVAAAMMLVCTMAHWSLIICEDLISSKKFGIAVSREACSGDRLVVMGDYETANSLNFYQPLPVEIVDGTAYALIPGMKYPDAPEIILTKQEFREAWQSNGRVFVLLPEDRKEELQPEGVEVMRLLDRVLVRNH
jgi:hypothetical protein